MATPTTLPATFVAGNVLTAQQMNDLRGAFRVLQVVSATKTDTFTISSATFTDITGISVSITPSATSSKILILADIKLSAQNATEFPGFRLVRDTTAIYVGDAAGTRIQGTYGGNVPSSNVILQGVGMHLDSPSTTSATTYKVQIRSATGTSYVNRSHVDTDSASFYRTASSITVMEISA
jgi:hypothetical protein